MIASIEYDQIMAFEDHCQDCNVFVSGINGRPSHSDSYNTVLDFNALDKAFNSFPEQWTRDQWEDALQYWTGCDSCPVIKLMAVLIRSKLARS